MQRKLKIRERAKAVLFDPLFIEAFTHSSIMQGIGVNAFDPKKKLYPLTAGVDMAKSSDTRDSSRY